MPSNTAVLDRYLVNYEKHDRQDGYDWQAKLRVTYTNDVAIDLDLAGTLSQHINGLEWTTNLTVTGSPAVTNSNSLVRSISAVIDYETDPNPRANGKRPANVRLTFHRADGLEFQTAGVHLLPTRRAEPSVEKILDSVAERQTTLPFPTFRTGDGSDTVTEPRLPGWFCTESCASGCAEFLEVPIGYAVCVGTCMTACLAD